MNPGIITQNGWVMTPYNYHLKLSSWVMMSVMVPPPRCVSSRNHHSCRWWVHRFSTVPRKWIFLIEWCQHVGLRPECWHHEIRKIHFRGTLLNLCTNIYMNDDFMITHLYPMIIIWLMAHFLNAWYSGQCCPFLTSGIGIDPWWIHFLLLWKIIFMMCLPVCDTWSTNQPAWCDGSSM